MSLSALGTGTLNYFDGTEWVALGAAPLPTVTVSGETSDTVTNIGGTDYRIVVWESSGDLVVTGGDLLGAEFLVVGGGASGGRNGSGNTSSAGSGAGDVVGGTVTISSGTHPVTVGAGGSGNFEDFGVAGSVSTFYNLKASGGGGGASVNRPGFSGACGGGGGSSGGPVNQPGGQSVSGRGGGGSGFGSGTNVLRAGGGGGGVGGAGGDASSGTGGNGGPGVTSAITGTPTGYGGGGGGGGGTTGGSATDGGGAGGGPSSVGAAGIDGTGGGGGGTGGLDADGGDGGDGIIIVRWPTANEA